MSLSILNNISSLAAQNQLSVNGSSLQKTLLQLSSGSRINSGADDAAGLAIADGFHANVTALTQSARSRLPLLTPSSPRSSRKSTASAATPPTTATRCSAAPLRACTSRTAPAPAAARSRSLVQRTFLICRLIHCSFRRNQPDGSRGFTEPDLAAGACRDQLSHFQAGNPPFCAAARMHANRNGPRLRFDGDLNLAPTA
jgi:hypothetical protein